MAGLPCPPPHTSGSSGTPDTAPVWGPRTVHALGWPRGFAGLTEAQGSEGLPEASGPPAPHRGSLYLAALMGPSRLSMHRGTAPDDKSGSRAADYCTRPTWPDGPWPFLWSPSPGPHARGAPSGWVCDPLRQRGQRGVFLLLPRPGGLGPLGKVGKLWAQVPSHCSSLLPIPSVSPTEAAAGPSQCSALGTPPSPPPGSVSTLLARLTRFSCWVQPQAQSPLQEPS